MDLVILAERRVAADGDEPGRVSGSLRTRIGRECHLLRHLRISVQSASRYQRERDP